MIKILIITLCLIISNFLYARTPIKTSPVDLNEIYMKLDKGVVLFKADYDFPVYATFDGRIDSIRKYDENIIIYIKHAGSFDSVYLVEMIPLFDVNDDVKEGQILGFMKRSKVMIYGVYKFKSSSEIIYDKSKKQFEYRFIKNASKLP